MDGCDGSNNGFTKRFFQTTLTQLANDNIITGYTRDKLVGMLCSENRKDYNRAKNHIMDIMKLHDSFEEAPPPPPAVAHPEGGNGVSADGPKRKGRRGGKEPLQQ